MFSKFAIRILVIFTLLYALSGNILSPQAAPAGNILRVKAGATGDSNGSSWLDAYPSLQTALTAAVSGDEIWVAAGVYKPTLRTAAEDARTATFQLKSGVALYGGFAGTETARDQRNSRVNLTILSGDLDGNDTTSGGVVTNPANIVGDNAYHVVSSVSATVKMDGFVITAGKANAANPHSLGAGLYNTGGTLLLGNMTFSGNRAQESGGGLFGDSGGNLTLVNVAFRNNSAAVAGGGMYVRYNTTLLENCLFYNNASELTGGGFWNEAATPTLVNCTFSGNTGGTEGGAIYNWGVHTEITIHNSILWGNTAPTNPQMNTPLAQEVTYSLVQGGLSGTGNIDSDPQFLSADNLCLRPTSPAIDAGNNAAVPADVLDLDGDGNTSEKLSRDLLGGARFADIPTRPNTGAGTAPIVDMGACEMQNSMYLPILRRP
jgi:predicted outer membrane repeat protein